MNIGSYIMVIKFPISTSAAADRRMQQLILSMLAGVGGLKLHVAPVACWIDEAGRIKPAHVLPEAA